MLHQSWRFRDGNNLIVVYARTHSFVVFGVESEGTFNVFECTDLNSLALPTRFRATTINNGHKKV